MTPIKLYLFGPPRLEQAGKSLPVGRRKGLALLVYLAVTDRSQHRDALATLLWPDSSQRRARGSLRQVLSELNKLLGNDCLLVDGDQIALVRQDQLWLDVAQFRICFEQSQSHDHSPEEVCSACLPFLQEAADLYTADFLEGFTLRDAPEFDEWQFFQAESLRRELALILRQLVHCYSDLKEYEAAIPYARRWLALDPLHEPVQRALMQLYAQSGQEAAALRQYEEHAKLLEAELGLPPEEETMTLYEAIKAKRILEPFLKAEAHRQKTRLEADKRQAKPKADEPPAAPVAKVETPPDRLPFPIKMGRYELLAEIGQGNFATVYRAHDSKLDRLVALKELKAAWVTGTGWVERFQREAKFIARLDHPHIVPIYDVGQWQDRHFIVMRLVEGQSLAERLDEQGRMTWAEAVTCMRAVAAGLDYAHHRGVLHRDLKPANILIDPERGPQLSDFGVARLMDDTSRSHSRELVGTPCYIAPEVWDGQPATPQADIYALGCILYEMLTGEKLFAGDSTPSVMRAHFQPLTLPERWPDDVPAGLAGVLKRVAAGQPTERYATAAELVAALTDLDEAVETGSVAPTAIGEAEPAYSRGKPAAVSDAPPLPSFLTAETTPPPPSIFVARERELAELEAALVSTQAGHGQILFVIGGAGRGKTVLTQEFARRAQAEVADLVVVTGYCDAMTGVGDPYLPFRGALTMLTGDVEAKWAGGLISQAHAQRLWELMPLTLPALVQHAPDLIGNFIPAQALQNRAELVASSETPWLKSLTNLTKAEANGGLEQQRIFSQYTALLKAIAAQRPILFIIEDLHWVDTASSGLLFHLSRQIGDSRILILGTYRPEEVPLIWSDAHHPLAGLVSELKRQHGDIWLDLGDLTAIEGRQFIDAYLDTQPNKLDHAFREALFRHTDGYALFTVELLRDMQDRGDLKRDESGAWVTADAINWRTLPVKVEGVIEKRIQRLDIEWQSVLTVASVEGEIFTAEVVAQVQQLDERRLVQQLSRELDKQHRLVTAQTLERVGRQRLSRYRFRHHLFQHYLYHSLDEMERGYLHEAVGNVLELLYENRTEDIAVQLAWHFQEAGLVDKAITYLQQAGDVAAQMYAYTEAIGSYRQALSLIKTHGVDYQELTQIYSHLGRTLELNAQFDEALATYEEMEQMARQQGHRPMELAALMAQVTLYITPTPIHDPVKGPALGLETLALARELGDQPAEVKTLWNLALGGMWSGRTVEGITYGEQAAALAREHHLTDLLAYALNDLGMLYLTRLHLEQAKQALGEAGSLWRELDNLPMLTDSMSMKSAAHIHAGEYDQAIALSDEAFQISESSNNLWGQSFSRMLICWAYWEIGQPDQALRLANESIRLGKLAGFIASQVLTGGYRAAIYGSLGAIESGLALAQEAVTAAETQFPHFRCHPLGVLAQLQLMAGNLAEAEAIVEQGKNDPYGQAHPAWNMRIHLAEIELAIKQGDYEQTIALVDDWLSKLRQKNFRTYQPTLLHLKGQALAAINQTEAAVQCWLEARDTAEAINSRASLWPVLLALSQLEPDPAAAQRLHQQARQIVESIAGHIGDSHLRSAFLNLPQVRAALETGTPSLQ
ncbi:MAG: protein kinase [Anaerolineales bacterium]|nr:protein kinase [Anaerolineales bacterium]